MSDIENSLRIYGHSPAWYDSYRRLVYRCADKIRLTKYPIVTQLIAETLATLIFIFYGDGSIAQKFFLNTGFLAVGLGWGAAATLGVVVGGKACPAFMNPAVAVAIAMAGRLRWFLLPLYVVLEVLGGLLGAAFLLAVYDEPLVNYANAVDGGNFFVNSTGGIFVAGKNSSVGAAVADQIITTGLLLIGILAISNKKPQKFTPLLVGLALYLGVLTYTANASSALNPARDLGPRMLLAMSHWGVEAFTVDDYYFWVPAVMPIVGAVAGTIIYEMLVGIHSRAEAPLKEKSLDDLSSLSLEKDL